MTISHTYLDGRPVEPTVTGRIINEQVDQAFVTNVLALLGDVRALYVFDAAGTTLVDKSKNKRLLTWSEEVSDFDAPPRRLGSGREVVFNSIDEEGDAPDSDDLSFGDGKVDQAFSVFALVRFVHPTDSVMICKYDTSAGQEGWLFEIDNARRLRFNMFDDGASARIGRTYSQLDDVGTYQLVAGTYDGSGAGTGIRLLENAARVDNGSDDSGTYVAMENGTELMALGYRQAAGVKENFLAGAMALAGVVGKELQIEELWELKELCNGYFGLSL